MPHDRDALWIDVIVHRQAVEDAAQTPRPGPDRPRVIHLGKGPAGTPKKRVDAVVVAVVEIRVDIAAVDRGQAVAARQQAFDGPEASPHAAVLFAGTVVGDAELAAVAHPVRVEVDAAVRMDRMVATEVEAEEDRRRRPPLLRQIEEDIEGRCAGVAVD